MDFFEQIGKHLTSAGHSIVKQTKNFSDISQINSVISEKEKRVSQLLIQLGQQYYIDHSDDVSAEKREIIMNIDTLYAEIELERDKIKKIKGVEKCPKCNADVPLNAAFCNACGTQIIQNNTGSVENLRYCPVCHAVLYDDDLFCTNCGQKIEKL